MSSLRMRLIAGTLAGITLFLAIGGVAIYGIVRASLMVSLDRSLISAAKSSGQSVSEELARREFTGVPLWADPLPLVLPAGDQFVARVEGTGAIDRSSRLAEESLPELGRHAEQPVLASVQLPDGTSARAVWIQPEPIRPRLGPPRTGPRRSPPRDTRGPLPPGAEDAQRTHRDPQNAPPALELVIARPLTEVLATLGQVARLLVASWALACAGCGAILFWGVHHGLGPLRRLRAQIETLDETDLNRRFEIAGAPEELVPVIEQLDRFVERIGAALERERAFSANAAHELRTPIAGLRATLELALLRDREPEAYRVSARECLEIIEQMQFMIEQLLDLALPAGDAAPEVIELEALVDRIWSRCQPEAEQRQVRLTTRIEDGLRPRTQPVLLERILANLIENAARYADTDTGVELTASGEGQGLCLRVSNSARSAPTDVAEHAFEVFWRADSARTGGDRHLGLGLPLSRRLAELLGGQLELSCERGVFEARLTLPQA